MSAGLSNMRVATGAAVVSVAAMVAFGFLGVGGVLGVAPALAKSDSTLSGPRFAQAHHAFRLTVVVGDDGGTQPASARLEVREGRGHYHWCGTWHRLHRTDEWHELYAFAVNVPNRGPVTFQAVITGYAPTNAITVVVR